MPPPATHASHNACLPVNRMTDMCKNITFSQTSFAGSKNIQQHPTSKYIHNLFVSTWNIKIHVCCCRERELPRRNRDGRATVRGPDGRVAQTLLVSGPGRSCLGTVTRVTGSVTVFQRTINQLYLISNTWNSLHYSWSYFSVYIECHQLNV